MVLDLHFHETFLFWVDTRMCQCCFESWLSMLSRWQLDLLRLLILSTQYASLPGCSAVVYSACQLPVSNHSHSSPCPRCWQMNSDGWKSRGTLTAGIVLAGDHKWPCRCFHLFLSRGHKMPYLWAYVHAVWSWVVFCSAGQTFNWFLRQSHVVQVSDALPEKPMLKSFTNTL